VKIDLASLITIAANLTKNITLIREIVRRDHPGDLAAFDAQVAAAQKPWKEAADAARAEEGGQ
jgi:hypothetical protein